MKLEVISLFMIWIDSIALAITRSKLAKVLFVIAIILGTINIYGRRYV